MRVALPDGEVETAPDSGRPNEESNCAVGSVRVVVADVSRRRLSVTVGRWLRSAEVKLSRFEPTVFSGGMAASVSAFTVLRAFERASGERESSAGEMDGGRVRTAFVAAWPPI